MCFLLKFFLKKKEKEKKSKVQNSTSKYKTGCYGAMSATYSSKSFPRRGAFLAEPWRTY